MKRRFVLLTTLLTGGALFGGCDCGGPSPVVDAAFVDAGAGSLDASTVPALDAHVALDAAHEADAFLEVDAAAEDAAAPSDASCPDAGGPHNVDDAGMCPPGWEPTPGGWCVTDFVPPAACR